MCSSSAGCGVAAAAISRRLLSPFLQLSSGVQPRRPAPLLANGPLNQVLAICCSVRFSPAPTLQGSHGAYSLNAASSTMLRGGGDDAWRHPRACPHPLAVAARQEQSFAAHMVKMLAVAWGASHMHPAEPRVYAVAGKVDHTTPIYFKTYQLLAAATAHLPACHSNHQHWCHLARRNLKYL